MTVWAWYLLNRLWQETVAEEAGEALRAAVRLGLDVRPAAWRARRVARGRLDDGSDVRVEWRGGLLGLRTVIYRGDTVSTYPLVCDGDELAEALRIEP